MAAPTAATRWPAPPNSIASYEVTKILETAGHPAVAEVRGRGLMVALEFADPDGLQPRPDLAKAFIQAAFERNLLLLSCGTYGQVVRIIPPLITNDTEVDSAISAMSEALAVIGS